MSYGARRLARLPQPLRLDYNLIPAPLDLSLPRVTEKSPLPAIIVTPSSPSVDVPEYYIAFLTPPPKPSLRERINQFSPFQAPYPFKSRAIVFIAFLLFILVCHLLAHLAVNRPHFTFKSTDIAAPPDSHVASSWNFASFEFPPIWGSTVNEDGRDYIVEQLSQAAHR